MALVLLALAAAPLGAQNAGSDSWAATDALGRKVRSAAEAPSRRGGKQVIIFYSSWHQGGDKDDATYSPKNISKILRDFPDARFDAGHPAWGDRKPGNFFWEEPLFGYYRTTDKWVLRKHGEMLADAGVDAVCYDCTNGSLTWEESYEAIFETWDQARKDGVDTPKVIYMLPFAPAPHALVSLRQLYRDVYKPGRYKDQWFFWKGKPCIMAYPEMLTDSPEDREIAEFFTFRAPQPDYVDGPWRNDQWGWLENYPQHGYVKTVGPDGKPSYELVTVGVAQNTSPDRKGHCGAFNMKDAQGRNFSARKGFDPRTEGYLYGWNFSEQWDRADELDPELVYVTGWNEWTAGMWFKQHGWQGEPFSFVDQFDWNHSRDIEPVKAWGDRGDVYYLQLVDRVRKFKGMDAAPEVSAPKTIRPGRVSDWEDVAPHYIAYKGNTFHRDAAGYFDSYYVDTSGRNDIVGAKVARDSKNIYFYAETDQALSPSSDPHWMQLLVDVDRDKATGWNGYDFIINRISPKGGKAVVESNVQGTWMWEKTADCGLSKMGNVLVLSVPRDVLGLGGGDLDFEFKWNDNLQREGDIMDFYISGDTAPGGRFNYVYTTGDRSRSRER